MGSSPQPLVTGGDPDRFEDARRELRPIYDRHVVPRERKLGKLAAGPSLGQPPEFDPDRESIEQHASKGKWVKGFL